VAVALNDMASALKLYRDILGMEVKAAQGFQPRFGETGLIADIQAPEADVQSRHGQMARLTLAEITDATLVGRKSGFAVGLWPGEEEKAGFGNRSLERVSHDRHGSKSGL